MKSKRYLKTFNSRYTASEFLNVLVVRKIPEIRSYSRSLTWAIIARNHLPFFKMFSNFVHFCPNFQIFCLFLPFFWKIARMPLLSRISPGRYCLSSNDFAKRLWILKIHWFIFTRRAYKKGNKTLCRHSNDGQVKKLSLRKQSKMIKTGYLHIDFTFLKRLTFHSLFWFIKAKPL